MKQWKYIVMLLVRYCIVLDNILKNIKDDRRMIEGWSLPFYHGYMGWQKVGQQIDEIMSLMHKIETKLRTLSEKKKKKKTVNHHWEAIKETDRDIISEKYWLQKLVYLLTKTLKHEELIFPSFVVRFYFLIALYWLLLSPPSLLH